MNNVISTKVEFCRNLKEYKFMSKLETSKRQEILDRLTTVLNKKLSYINLETTDEKIISFLLENNLINQELLIGTEKSLFLSQKDNLAVVCFQKEHINIVACDIGCTVKTCFQQAKTIADLLKDKLELAYSDEYGFLASDITRIGTGLKIECVISLPCITELGKINQVKQNLRKLGYDLTIGGKDSLEYKISTMANLGYTESQICEEFVKMIKRLQELELESAKILDSGNHDEMLDRTMRSLSLMSNAYLMPTDELKTHLTNMRIGLNLNYIPNIKLDSINRIQKLITNKNENYISKSQLIDLAAKTKEILKGE